MVTWLLFYFNHSGGRIVPSNLNWETRLNVALEVAKGLEYLHEEISPPVIHRDFKSNNILLDKNFHAKVSDFGLAKLGSEKAGGHVSTRVLGTQGYVAPEYGQNLSPSLLCYKSMQVFRFFFPILKYNLLLQICFNWASDH